jgi:hypothetical protein
MVGTVRLDVDSLISRDILDEMAAMARACPPGCFMEVGVYKGGSAVYLDEAARAQSRELYLFDTFSGIPYRTHERDSHQVGDFADGPGFRAIREMFPDAYVVQGIFPESAQALIMPPVAFVHLDVDQYKSYRDAICFLRPRMVEGGVMWFDDYDCLPSATLAVDEMLGAGAARRAPCGKAYWRA